MSNKRLTAQEVFRNKLRGAFSSAGRKRGYKTDSQYIADIYKREALIVKILSDARSELSESQLREFEGWLADQQRLQGSGYPLGVSEPLLGLAIGRVAGGSLDSALRLAVADLRRAGEMVQDFLTELTRLSLEISKEDFASALDVLHEIAKKFGYSYWLIETEVALLSFSGKVELARERVKSVALGKRGLGPYIFHATGQRCDPSQSPVRHKALVKKRISESPIAEEMKAYLLYRINRELPPDESVLAALMGIEKSSCRQDVLMTGLQVCANIIARSEAFRQSTCELAWGFVSEFGNIYKPLMHAEHVESLALSSELANEVDEWVIEVISGAPGNSSRIEAAFKAALDVRASEVEEYLHRYTGAFSWHPLALQLGGGAGFKKLTKCFVDSAQRADPGSSLVQKYIQHRVPEYIKRLPESIRANFINLLGINSEERLEVALVQRDLDGFWTELNSIQQDCFESVLIEQCVEYAKYDQAVVRMAACAIRNASLIPYLPYSNVFLGRQWKTILSYGVSIELCVALQQYYSLTGDHQAKSYKRFAVSALMKKNGCHELADLVPFIASRPKLGVELLEYFAIEVCDLPLIELLPGIKDTNEARLTQAKLLRVAADYSESQGQLLAMAEAVVDEITVESARKVLDDTKVYVAEDQLASVAEREFAADFQRYQRIRVDDTDDGDLLEAAFRDIRQNQPGSFQVPKSEADELLYELVSNLLELFLKDQANGLDSVIGRRIRHGTISGELRGTLEQVGMIGQRPNSGADYEPPAVMAKTNGWESARAQRVVNSAFARFSGGVDTLVAQLRDEAFNCSARPNSKLRPIFELPMTPVLFSLVRSLSKDSTDIRSFARRCFSVFWITLNTKLERERSSVSLYTKKSLKDLTTRLQDEIRSNAGVHSDFLLGQAQMALELLQNRAAVICDWIRVPKMSEYEQHFPLSLAIDTVLSLAKSKHHGFEPIILLRIERNSLLNLAGLSIVVDALQIAIDNIAEHSGSKKGKVAIDVTHSSDGGNISFGIVSDIAKSAWSKDKASRLDQIRADILSRRAGDRAKANKGSGLSKLATIVQQYPGTDLSFKIIEGASQFELRFDLPKSEIVQSGGDDD